MPKVSVVMASYDHAKFVRQSLDSILAQSFQDFEIIVTDDGSSDSTADIIRGIKDRRIKVEVFSKNRGACVAMNACIARATGEYVAVLNSDDYFLPGKLDAQVKELDRRSEIAALFTRPLIVDERGAPLPKHPLVAVFDQTNHGRYQWLNHLFHKGNALCHPTLMIRRACYDELGGYDPRLFQLPDLDMWVRLCSRFDIDVMPERLTAFRILDRELNASAARPEAHVRTMWEHGQVVRHFRGLAKADFSAVFAGEIGDRGLLGQHQDVALGRLAAQTNIASHQAFGLDLLYEAIGKGLDGIDAKELSTLAKSIDPYNVRGRLELAAIIAQFPNRERDIARLSMLERSTAWKLAAPLRVGANALHYLRAFRQKPR